MCNSFFFYQLASFTPVIYWEFRSLPCGKWPEWKKAGVVSLGRNGEAIKGWDEHVAIMKKSQFHNATPRSIWGVKYEARLENKMLVSKSENHAEFHIDDGYLCPAIHKALKTMRGGEEAELLVKFSCKMINVSPSSSSDSIRSKDLTFMIKARRSGSIPPSSSISIDLESSMYHGEVP
ncbi:hypothetical protein Nepgr_031266 [Nepenthes gracilis]|uniref:Rotamase n=1 Tax=Nepenthes gracilis TaxID=150966 RepID=A0AAD3TI51_NEPGR|nr:hypothetical protein Nepgr_031266 [Nepenthes gracilis]